MIITLFKKLKTALKSSHPLDAIKEIINEYDELINLAEWRKDVLKNGKNIRRNQKELDRIAKMLEDSGYYNSSTSKDIEKDVREFFRNM